MLDSYKPSSLDTGIATISTKMAKHKYSKFPVPQKQNLVMLGAMVHGYIVDKSRACIRIGLLYVLVKDS
jgi:hypothetical protein